MLGLLWLNVPAKWFECHWLWRGNHNPFTSVSGQELCKQMNAYLFHTILWHHLIFKLSLQKFKNIYNKHDIYQMRLLKVTICISDNCQENWSDFNSTWKFLKPEFTMLCTLWRLTLKWGHIVPPLAHLLYSWQNC